MRRFLRCKRGLGTPVANLIIIMATVILSTTVVLFAMNVTASQVQKESLYIPSTHIWYENETRSVAALGLTNNGATDVVITKLEIKGLQTQWAGNESFVIYAKTNGTLPGDLPYAADFFDSSNRTVYIGGTDFNFTAATAGLTLKSGCSMAFYVAVPNRIMMYDLATAVRMVLSTTQAVYCTETLVQTI